MSTDDATWDSRYPDQSILRDEIDAMTEAFLEALFSVFPRPAIAGVYAKGSTRKRWDSLLDYVPELSDVDFHVLFADDRPREPYFPSVESGLLMQRTLEEGYARRVREPVHTPRVQLVIANALQRHVDFIHSVPHTVQTLVGLPYPAPRVDREKSLGAARRTLLAHESFLRDLGERVADKAGRYLWELLRDMNWRVGPTGPRVLELRGAPFLDAWGANRTAVRRMLIDRGEHALAADYAAYYLNGWQHFLSSRRDSEAARQAILAGARGLARGIEIAVKTGEAGPER
jgi:hypothetical protein